MSSERIAIVGGPRTGKTTYAATLAAEDQIRHTDDLISEGWSAASESASHWFDDPEAIVIEGVAVIRALRKWLTRNPEGKPCEQLIILSRAFEALSKGQLAMTKGCQTVFTEILPTLQQRGVEIVVKDLHA